jgi:SAM-dependent methyltransferase
MSTNDTPAPTTIPALRDTWEIAAPGWARWEPTVVSWMGPATELMLDMAGVGPGARVIDVASGAGSQTLLAAERVRPEGRVLATDISETMLRHVEEAARAAGLSNVSTLAGPAEELALEPEGFDAAICRLGLMLFADPVQALRALQRALRPGGRIAAVVFTTPSENPMMSRPMEILLRHAGKAPPAPGKPGIFALGGPGVLARVLAAGGFVDVEQRTVEVPLRMGSAREALLLMQEAFGAYRAVVADQPEAVQAAAWREVGELLETLTTPEGFVAPSQVVVGCAMRAAVH